MIIALAICFCSCNKRNTYFDRIAKNDIPLPVPQHGDWLYIHKEKGQTWKEYQAIHPVKASAERSVIYLLPVGDFGVLQKEMIAATCEYNALFFQLKTIVLPGIDDNVPQTAMRTFGDDNHIQLLASYLLDSIVKSKKPKDAIVLLAISAKDLYPQSSWNYVFGLASYNDQVGVSSIYRLQESHLDSTNFKTALRRLLIISTHEIGHMFSMHHCTHAKCTMNGTNGLEETDRTPARLCAVCQQKLSLAVSYNNEQRQQQLLKFFHHYQLEGDEALLKKDAALQH
ncbi:archaemetzincin [Chitinophaga sp. Cy-1792]|uniref:archaemetzincin n=1 Tax=Chitinophaga sp. Cy-1792 TaxID=2608339 RepID=UPI00142110CD|nr:archaemetzincin [Chitinophaga sp. Cy-1792]